MTITVLSNLSPGAPPMRGQPGATLAVMDYCLVGGLGWTRAFDTTNVAVYRMPPGTTQSYLRIDDTIPTYARVTMYETMTGPGLDDGTNRTPSEAQFGTGLFWAKSNINASDPRPWYFVSDGKFFHFVITRDWDSFANRPENTIVSFGDVQSMIPGDQYNTLLMADADPNPAGWVTYSAWITAPASRFNIPDWQYAQGIYMLRKHDQTGGGIIHAKQVDAAYGDFSYFGNGALAYPSASGGIEMARVYVGREGVRRGYVPGIWCSYHPPQGWNDFDTFSGGALGPLAGRTFTTFRFGYQRLGAVILETSDTWGQ